MMNAGLVCRAQKLPPSRALAFTAVTIIDGTGRAPTSEMTVVISDGSIREIGKDGRIRIPREPRL